ncbi:MAG: glycosyltransferase family 39 protein [Nanoarchaeota archaeon]
MNKENFYKTGYILSLNLSIIAILLMILSLVEIIDLDIFLSYKLLSGILIASLTLTVFYKHNLDRSRNQYISFIESILQTSPYFFLSILMILAINQFLKFEFIIQRNFHLIALGIAFGFLAFYKNRNKIEHELEEEKQRETQTEEQRLHDFQYKFPIINRIWGIRTIIRWFYAEGLFYSLTIILTIIIGTSLIFYNLGESNFTNDEFATMESASGFYFTSTFWKWDWIRGFSGEYTNCIAQDIWCHYTRAEIHSLLIASIYKLIGISEFSTRLVSAIFGLLLLITAYPLLRKFGFNKKVSLLALILITLNHKILEFSRYGRMYALMIPLVLWFILLTYILFNNEVGKKRLIWLTALTLFVLLLLYNLHSQNLIIVLVLGVIFMSQKLSKKSSTFLRILLILIALFILVIFLSNVLSIVEPAFEFVNFDQRIYNYNYEYINYIFDYPLPQIGFIICMSFILTRVFSPHKLDLISNLIAILIFSAAVLIFLIDRFPHPVYSSTLLPLLAIILAFSTDYFSKIFVRKAFKLFIFIIIITCAITSLINSFGEIYGSQSFYYADYEKAYTPLIENYQPEDFIIMGYSRKYYLKDLEYNGGDIFELGQKDYSTNVDNKFMEILETHKSGWITWDKFSEGDLKSSIRNYIEKNFKQYSGEGLDDTRVNVYYYNKSLSD